MSVYMAGRNEEQEELRRDTCCKEKVADARCFPGINTVTQSN